MSASTGVFKKMRHWLLGLLVRRLTVSKERAFWLILGAVLSHRGFMLLVILANTLAAVFEGSTVGILAVAVASITNDQNESLSSSLGAVGEYVDSLREAWGKEKLFLLLISAAVLGQILRSGLQYCGVVAAAFLQTRVIRDVQGKVVRQIMNMSYAEVSKHPAGVLQQYFLNAVPTSNIVAVINTLISTVLILSAYLVVLLWISWPMTVGAFVVVAIFTTSVSGISRRLGEIGKRSVRAGIKLNRRMVELLQAPKLIRIYGKEAYAVEQIEESVDEGLRAQREGLLWKGSIGPVLDTLTVLTGAGALIGGYWVMSQQGANVLPTLLAFVFVLYRIMGRVSVLSTIQASVANIMPRAENVAEILRLDNKTFTRRGGVKVDGLRTRIRFTDVSFRYPNAQGTAVRDVSFEIPKGSVVGLVGRSGAGKSTIIDLLLGLYVPNSGSIQMDAMELDHADVESWRSRFGVVSQDNFVFNDSVKRNIKISKPDATDAEVEAAARAAHAHEFILDLEQGYETLIGDRGYRLSGGQLQRLALARAILRDADVLVLDEATSSLDSVSERYIMQSVNELRGRITLVLIAHRLSTVVNADRILVLNEGRLEVQGTHEELLTKSPIYARLWKLQTTESRDPD